jgi:hypothetical protein
VLELETKLERMREELRAMKRRAEELELRMSEEVERARRSLGAELVPYRRYESRPAAAGRRPRPSSPA